MTITQINTSLGYPLEKHETGWFIDLSELKILKGLSVVAGVIGEIIVDRLKKNAGDLSFLYKINSNINPELIELQTHHIQVHGRADLLADIIQGNAHFVDDLVTVFGTLQRPSWLHRLYPDEKISGEINGAADSVAGTTALIFPFGYMSGDMEKHYNIILERDVSFGEGNGYFLRLTYESKAQRILDLSAIPHVEVNDLDNRVYISGSTRMAGSVRDSIVNACNRGIKTYSEENRIFSHMFEQLMKTRLGRLEKINFNWNDAFSRVLSESTPEGTLLIFKKIFLTFEAGSICSLLIGGETVTVRLKSCHFTLYLSQLNRVLNININLPRSSYSAGKYLRRMPLLARTAAQGDHDLDFSNIGIFLIHHITSEIVAFIEALRQLNAASVHTLFVKYGGVIPSDYLDTLLEIPSDFLFTAALTRQTTIANRNYFTLADCLNDTCSIGGLDEVLRREKLDFFPAMRLVAGHMFFKFCLKIEQENKRLLLVEDGGYLAPVLNTFAISGKSVAEVFARFHVDAPAPDGDLRGWLDSLLTGTVEHTKNGYDRLMAVQEKYQRLAFPGFSIAVSHNKLREESQEVAHSILSAVESVLHGQGRVLSQRKTILLGANGNIGRFLRHYLKKGRLHTNALPLISVDRTFGAGEEACYASVGEIPEQELLKTDLFIGMTGVSLLKRDLLERLVMKGEKRDLYFVSGSTKTVEFTDLSDWIDQLFNTAKPLIGGMPVCVRHNRIFDPMSDIDQGRKVEIRFPDTHGETFKTLYLLNDLTPINFLYYGVPTETMDMVLNQLLSVSLGMGDLRASEKVLSPRLYAVDHEIDAWGHPL